MITILTLIIATASSEYVPPPENGILKVCHHIESDCLTSSGCEYVAATAIHENKGSAEPDPTPKWILKEVTADDEGDVKTYVQYEYVYNTIETTKESGKETEIYSSQVTYRSSPSCDIKNNVYNCTNVSEIVLDVPKSGCNPNKQTIEYGVEPGKEIKFRRVNPLPWVEGQSEDEPDCLEETDDDDILTTISTNSCFKIPGNVYARYRVNERMVVEIITYKDSGCVNPMEYNPDATSDKKNVLLELKCDTCQLSYIYYASQMKGAYAWAYLECPKWESYDNCLIMMEEGTCTKCDRRFGINEAGLCEQCKDNEFPVSNGTCVRCFEERDKIIDFKCENSAFTMMIVLLVMALTVLLL